MFYASGKMHAARLILVLARMNKLISFVWTKPVLVEQLRFINREGDDER